MKKLSKLILLVLAAALLLAACKKDEIIEETAEPIIDETPVPLEAFSFTPDTFPRMDGTLSTIPLGQALASVMLGQSREYAEPLTLFTGSSQAFRNLADGLCDIIITGEPSPSVLDEISRQNFSYDMAPIATDALVFVVSASNPVNNLTSEQVRAIYSGEMTGWQQAGGADFDIVAFQRNEEASSQVLMEKHVMDWGKMADAPMQEISSYYFMSDDDDAASAIKGFDGSIGAIGYTMYYYAANMGASDGYKILSIDGIMPNLVTISNGTYPFLSNYYVCLNNALPEDDNARILYNWLLSDEGQSLISSEGYVSVRDSQVSGGNNYVAPVQLRWNISTDDSNLTPYNTSPPLSSRVTGGALPELIPSADYGRLLPYSSTVTMNDGSIYAVKHGFVTESGVVVTDPVYDGITGAIYSTQAEDTGKSAYRLHMDLPEDDPNYGYQTIQAACAEDGSWITDFKYANIVFRQSVIFLMYGYDTFDIDVYDYSGNLLYNILDLEWMDSISEDAWPEYLIYSESEGLSFIPLADGTCGAIDIHTGELRETGFITNAYMFSDGLVSVQTTQSGELWGFVDRELEIVLPAQYVSEAVFIDGRAIVTTEDGESHIIDKQGQILFSVESGYIISTLPDNKGYAIYSLSEFTFPIYITYDFEEIPYPPEALPLGPESSVVYMYSGRFYCMSENGTWLFSADECYALPSSVHQITGLSGGYISYVEYDADGGSSRAGVMMLDGTVVIEPSDEHTISFVPAAGGATWIAVNSGASSGGSDFINDSYKHLTYSLIDPSGSDYAAIKTGAGILSYESALGLLFVQASDHFSWLTVGGDKIVKIPSMAYSFD